MTLPIPDPSACEHSNKLLTLIRDDINKAPNRYISFARFMELALYAPGLGYYSAGSHKLGREGDFVTAPEISPLFAKCIANQCRELFQETSGDFLELGAGSGIFAKDLLTQLQQYGTLPNHYYILEVSAELRERQRELLQKNCADFFPRIIWLDKLPPSFSGIIFANEVMDAMPVNCFLKDDQMLERVVTLKDEKLIWDEREPTPELKIKLAELDEHAHLPKGYQSEINLALSAWVLSLADILEKGAILLSDYGYGRAEYYHPDRAQGTLNCFFRHHQHSDPFFYPGLQDITAHVDFTTVAEAGVFHGLALSGYTTQSAFLLASGILDFAEQNKGTEKEKYLQNQAIKTLTLPSQMGELIKMICFTKDISTHPLLGFTLYDRRRDL
jgi:SAM-dependent MidA family methyltransferase